MREKLPREPLAEMKPVTYKSSDGLEIPAYLALPKGVPAKALPLIMVPHGGPSTRDTWAMTAFPVPGQPRLRRSSAQFPRLTGYGKKFLNAGNLQWGRAMQDDVTWGVRCLVAQGIANPKRVGILGGWSGGYGTLAGVAFPPDVYAAAVDIVGPFQPDYLA